MILEQTAVIRSGLVVTMMCSRRVSWKQYMCGRAPGAYLLTVILHNHGKP